MATCPSGFPFPLWSDAHRCFLLPHHKCLCRTKVKIVLPRQQVTETWKLSGSMRHDGIPSELHHPRYLRSQRLAGVLLTIPSWANQKHRNGRYGEQMGSCYLIKHSFLCLHGSGVLFLSRIATFTAVVQSPFAGYVNWSVFPALCSLWYLWGGRWVALLVRVAKTVTSKMSLSSHVGCCSVWSRLAFVCRGSALWCGLKQKTLWRFLK